MFRVVAILVFTLLIGSPATAEPLLVRQAPVLKGNPIDSYVEPAPGRSSGYERKRSILGNGSAAFLHELDRGGGGEKRQDIRATLSFEEPPSTIVPGETIALKAQGTMSGHSYGATLRAPLYYFAEHSFGIKFQDSGVMLESRDLPVLKKRTTAAYYNAKHGGTLNRSTTATLKVSPSAGDTFAIGVAFGNQRMIWPYKRVETDDHCPHADALARALRDFESFEKIKGDPATYAAEVDFENEPFEICIKDGKAILKGEPDAWERAAGIAATLGEMYVGAVANPALATDTVATGGSVGAFGDALGKSFADDIRRKTREAAKEGTLAGGLRAIKAAGRRADVTEKLASSAMSEVFGDYEPSKIAEGRIAEVIENGHLEVSAAEGLQIYRDMTIMNEIVRQNAAAYYCRIIDGQRSLMERMQKLASDLSRDDSPACKASLEENRETLKTNYAKLRNDYGSASSRTGPDARYGNNWTFDAKYRDMPCIKAISSATMPRNRLFR